jgi:hypothetical protein
LHLVFPLDGEGVRPQGENLGDMSTDEDQQNPQPGAISQKAAAVVRAPPDEEQGANE